jgi:Glycosyltransferase like family
MIVFATSITSPETYERIAKPGIERAAEPDSEVLAFQSAGSIFRSYNLILDQVSSREGLEALVLVHQDAEIVDPEFCRKLRRALDDPEVGVVGSAGAVGVRSLAWWEGSVTWASFSHRYEENGGGELPALCWEPEEIPSFAHTGEVDAVDGFVLAVSPWVVRNVRFDESLGQLHGYDFDFCLQVRAAGRKVVTEDLRVVHQHSLDLVNDPDTWIAAHMRIAEKWDGRLARVGHEDGDWKQRARRAEAEAAAARIETWATLLRSEARLNEVTESVSWRLTSPLRRLNALRRRLVRRRG